MKKLLSAFMLILLVFSACGQKEAENVSVKNLKTHTEYITDTIGVRVFGTPKEQETADYVFAEFEKLGFSEKDFTLTRQNFVIEGKNSQNIIAVKKGENDTIITVVAHHDSVKSTLGAKDNATGTAALLEIARMLMATQNNKSEIRIISLGSEENGYHGSRAYTESLTKQEIENTIAAFNIDIAAGSKGDGFIPVCTTLGARNGEEYVVFDGLFGLDNAVSLAIEQAYFELGYFKAEDEGKKYKRSLHGGESDHISFHNAKIDSANVCIRGVEGERIILPKEYHKIEDTAQNIDYKTTQMITNAIVKAIEILDRQGN